MKHLIMGTAGHVDHGKTSLIKALTSIDCDTHPQEKERGITINLGFSHLDLPTGDSIGIIDMPGHKDFINTMVSGASGIDFVLLVIAADSGIMPQTKEHFNIIQSLGVKKMIVALNKIDLVDEELADLAELEIMEWLEETTFAESPIVGVSSTSGKGIEQLIHEIESIIPEIPGRIDSSFFRMYIDRFFTVKGKGSVITGSVINGHLNSEDQLYLLPGNQSLRIKGMHRHGKPTKQIISGNRAAINVSGFPKEDFYKGMLVSNQILKSTKMLDAYIHLFPGSRNLKTWSNVILHAATFEVQARMHLIDTDKLEGGNSCIAQLTLENDVIVLPKDHFVIRRSSGDETIGGGMVLDDQPLHHRKRTQKLVQQLQQLANGILHEDKMGSRILMHVDKASHPLKMTDLLQQLKIDQLDIDVSLVPGLNYYANENILSTEKYEEQIEKKLKEILKSYHLQNPLMENGLSLNELLGKFEYASEVSFKEFFPIYLEKLQKLKLLTKVGESWVLISHQVKLSQKDRDDLAWLEQKIRSYEKQKPIYTDIEEEALKRKIPKDKFQSYLNYLASQKKIVFFKGDYIHTHWVKLFRLELLKVLNKEEGGLYQQPLKEKTGYSKKMLPFLCEIFESEKLVKTSDYNKNNFKTEITDLGRKFLEA